MIMATQEWQAEERQAVPIGYVQSLAFYAADMIEPGHWPHVLAQLAEGTDSDRAALEAVFRAARQYRRIMKQNAEQLAIYDYLYPIPDDAAAPTNEGGRTK
jgi:hypothetical protein